MVRVRLIAISVILVIAAGCGPPERPKFKIKRASDYEPIRRTEAATNTAAATDVTATTLPAEAADTELAIVEVGAFRGACDQTFSGINSEYLVSLANPSGLLSYRLAGIAIPGDVREAAHQRLRQWLEGDALGIEVDPRSGGTYSAVFIIRCSTRTWINEELVREGLAMVVDVPSTHRDALNQASMEALTARRGVWSRK